MNLLSAEKLSKAYSDKYLFSDASIGIDEGEKIGVIGINGTGKSTLLKILSGKETPDSGRIITGNKVTIEYLSQNPVFDNDTSILQHIFKGNSPVMKLLREYENAIKAYNLRPEDNILEKNLLRLTLAMDNMSAWTIESEAKTILTKLGISDFDTKIGALSGGQRKRIALASALINPSDLLILDEPTNQLDNNTVDWLEKYLNSRKGALLMVTHDRYFLMRVCNRIVELDNGRLFSYQANYSKYLELKAQREESEKASDRKRVSLFRKELEWIRRGPQARSTKQKARIDRFDAIADAKSFEEYENVEIQVGTSRLGKKTIELEKIGKDFAGVKIIDDFSYNIARDDRIGIIGPNGSGKSTFLKIIAGKLEPDRGCISTGSTVKISFFEQENDDLDDNLRVIEYIRNEAEYITTANGQISAVQMLENFLFPADLQWSLISKLSGGEKRRLYLLKILMGAPNILLLDEPTNDLDIQTLTILESYLSEFQGAVIAVSHDRYFLDRVADKIFIFEGESEVTRFQGNYSDYYESTQKENIKTTEKIPTARTGRNDQEIFDKKNHGKADKQIKFTFKEQKEFNEIDLIIADLEKDIESLNAQIEQASSDYEKLQKLFAGKETAEKRLNMTMERWVYLNTLAEKISGQCD
ncbi:MAG: ABC-F family ATP-binding cassette domain-containing protein [Saccharofermentanales bacterium]